MNRRGEIPNHGTLSRYHGTTDVPACRCRQCKDRAVKEDALRLLDRLAGRPRHVSAEPAQRHLLKLQQRGLSYMQISRACGVHPTSLGEIARGRRIHIGRKAADAILAVPSGWTDSVGNVSSIGTARRLRALYAIGVSRATISAATGLSKDAINKLVNDDWAAIDTHRARVVRDVYDQLWSRPGDSVKNRYRAEREGWPGPLHWNDETIDDPDGFPDWTGACGTPLGYRRHRYVGITARLCRPCARAQAAKHAEAQLAA